MDGCEFLIVGAGIIGLTLARELVARGADNIVILEKETDLGFHASGRNSGVLHAGIYYPPKTLKAQLCLQGNLLLQAYCRENKLPLKRTGKVIVARNSDELPMLQELAVRAKQNGARVELIDEQTLAEIEPNAKTTQLALFSHDTAVVDNQKILRQLYQDLIASQKVKIYFASAFVRLREEFIAEHARGKIKFNTFINAAGAYADRVAHHFGVGKNLYLIPFKGIYQKLRQDKSHLVNGNIYPVPNLSNPFLGVHFTKNIRDEVFIGPTAIPAFGRENYGILRGIDVSALKIFYSEMMLFFTNAGFRQVALSEPKKYVRYFFYQDAKKLVKELDQSWLMKTLKVGIRPQLVDLKEKKMLMDFLIHKEKHALHILNAISPAFTSAMAFAKYVLDHTLPTVA